MPSRLRIAAVLVLTLLAATEARAQSSQGQVQGQGTLRQACRADFQRLCKGTQPGGGRILACLKAHDSDLSPDCKQALASAPAR